LTDLICARCIKNEDCGIKCEAWTKLNEIYQEARNKERHQLIKKYGRLLGIIDAEPSKELRKLGEAIIRKFPEFTIIPEYGIRVGYVLSQEKPQTTKVKYADCEKVKLKFQAWLPFDFIITFYEPNTELLSENQRKILMLHELKHIGIGERGFKIEDHDVEDFMQILEDYGLKWNGFEQEVPDILAENETEAGAEV
jgi:hypothetical protein